MNLKQFANVDSMYRDLDTGQEVPWHCYMRRVIDKLGLDNIKPYIPYEIDYLKEKLKEDVHLNNTQLQRWDEAGGFCLHHGEAYYTASGLQSFSDVTELRVSAHLMVFACSRRPREYFV